MQVAAAGLTLRGALVVRKRGCDIFIEEIGEIGFPTLREYVRPAIGHKNTLCLLKTPKAAKSLEFWYGPP